MMRDDSSSEPSPTKTACEEARLFLELAIPTTLLNFGFAISPLLTASYVGLKFGKFYLSAFTLANLTGNLCTFSLLAGLFSAADTLSPQAFGKGDYKELGLLAIRGTAAATILLVPINICLVLNLDGILTALGQDPFAAAMAAEWYRIFVLSLPFCVVYNATWKFLSSQSVMTPLLLVSLVSCCIILPIALEIFTEACGFLGSAMAYVFFQGSQSILLLLYLRWKRPHVPGSWPGLACWREALGYKPLMKYLSLGAGGIFAQSEWIYWEALGLIVGKLGVLPLAVHSIPNQVVMAACMAPFAFGTALAIRMGVTMTQSVRHTKRIVVAISLVSTVFFGFASILLYCKSQWIFGLFTNDPEVMALAHTIWWKVCCFSFNCSFFGIMCGIATGMGMQWTLGAVNFFFLWIFGVPIIYYSAVVQGGGLNSAWTWINAPYTAMNLSLLAIFATKDWHPVLDPIQATLKTSDETDLEMELESQRESCGGNVSEKTPLLG